jgi:hypothetical protein
MVPSPGSKKPLVQGANVDALRQDVYRFPVSLAGTRPPSIINLPISPVAKDGSVFHIKEDSSGVLYAATAYDASGSQQEMNVTGDWPNQTITFSKDGVEYLRGQTHLSAVKLLAAGNIAQYFIFYFWVTGKEHQINYEVVAPDAKSIDDPNYFAPFAAAICARQQLKTGSGMKEFWVAQSMVRSGFNVPSKSFLPFEAVDPRYVGTNISGAHPLKGDITLPDISIETVFKDEIALASYFLPVVTQPDNMPYNSLFLGRQLPLYLKMWYSCLGAGTVGVIFGGGMGAVAGCLGGAVSTGLVGVASMVSEGSPNGGPGGGGATGASPAGSQGPGSSSGVTPKKKEETVTGGQ